MWLNLGERVPNHVKDSAICGSNLEENLFQPLQGTSTGYTETYITSKQRWGEVHTWMRKRQAPQTKTSNKVLLLDENVENWYGIIYSNDCFTQLCGYSATFVQELQVRCLRRVHELVDVVGR